MRGGVVAPQNTFLDNILRRSNELDITFLIGNAVLSHHPIIYSSESFTSATGYSKKDVLHRDCSCQFLFGSLTNKDTIKKIHGTIDAKVSMQTEIVIYKKDNTPCWFLFHISPIKNDGEDVILFLITFKDISHLKEPIEVPTVSKWSRLVEKSLAKHKIELQKSTNNARSVFLQLAKKDAAKKQKLSQLMSTSSMNVQYSWEGSKTPKSIILHYSLFKTIWDWVILVLTLYTAVAAPFVVSFRYHQTGMVVFNLLVDIVFICDVVMNFRTSFTNKENEIIFNPKLICSNYLKSWFAVDFVAALPYGILNLIYTDGWIEIINVIKVIRLIRLARIARKLDHYLEFGATTLVLWLFMFCLVAHWMACIWYVIALNYDKPSTKYSWIYLLATVTEQPYHFINGTDVVKGSGPSTASLYMSSLYYCMSSLTTCGFGNIAPNTTAEKFFGCVTMLLGCFLYAFIFGQVTAIIQQLQLPSSMYHQKINNIRRFIKLYNVPHETGARLIDYFMTTWRRNKGLEVEEVLDLFPRDLRADLSVQIHKPVFECMPEFRTAPTPALRSISRYFHTLRTAPGDRVLQQGETIESLYFVVLGSLEIRRKGQIVGILGPGDVVGTDIRAEAGRAQRSFYDVYSLTYSDLHYVESGQFKDGLTLYPEFYRKFQRKIVYSFDLGNDMAILDKDAGKPRNRESENETTFIQRIPSTVSSDASQDQTMVEGEQSSSVTQLISLQHTSTRSKPTLLSNDDFDATSISEVVEEMAKLKVDFTRSLNEINAKLAESNDLMSYIKRKLDENPDRSSSNRDRSNNNRDRSNDNLTRSSDNPARLKDNSVRPSDNQARTTNAEPKKQASSSKVANQPSKQRQTSNNNEQIDDDNFVRQYKPASNRSNAAKKPSNVHEDLDEIEKAIEEIELSDRFTSQSRSTRVSTTRNNKNQKSSAVK